MAKQTKKFEIQTTTSLCKGCAICVSFCPCECLALDELGKVYVVDEDKCVGCRLCEIRCPELGITIREKVGVE